jgi:uncharacterized small protein (DUF1192 family)
MDESAEPRRLRGQAVVDLGREDLDLYALEELEERIAGLKREIERTQTQVEKKRSGRAAADALFKR